MSVNAIRHSTEIAQYNTQFALKHCTLIKTYLFEVVLKFNLYAVCIVIKGEHQAIEELKAIGVRGWEDEI